MIITIIIIMEIIIKNILPCCENTTKKCKLNYVSYYIDPAFT